MRCLGAMQQAAVTEVRGGAVPQRPGGGDLGNLGSAIAFAFRLDEDIGIMLRRGEL